jgi:hypothetical protein
MVAAKRVHQVENKFMTEMTEIEIKGNSWAREQAAARQVFLYRLGSSCGGIKRWERPLPNAKH